MYDGRVCLGRVVGRSGKGYESVRCVRVHLYRCDEWVVTPLSFGCYWLKDPFRLRNQSLARNRS